MTKHNDKKSEYDKITEEYRAKYGSGGTPEYREKVLAGDAIVRRLEDEDDPLTSVAIPSFPHYVLTSEDHIVLLQMEDLRDESSPRDYYRAQLALPIKKKGRDGLYYKLYANTYDKNARKEVTLDAIKAECLDAELELLALQNSISPEQLEAEREHSEMLDKLRTLLTWHGGNYSALHRTVMSRFEFMHGYEIPKEAVPIKDQRLYERMLNGDRTRHPDYFKMLIDTVYKEQKACRNYSLGA